MMKRFNNYHPSLTQTLEHVKDAASLQYYCDLDLLPRLVSNSVAMRLTMMHVFFLALNIDRIVNVEDAVVMPSLEDWQARVAETGKTLGQIDLAWHISNLCSTLTLWWAGSERRCSETVLS